MIRRWFFGWPMVVVVTIIYITTPATSQPQTNLLLRACSLLNATNTRTFFGNLNETFIEVRKQLTNNKTFFATAQKARSSEPIYMMAQCRSYMSTTDCLACYDHATSIIRACAAADGARAFLDGCFLRYENTDFYDEATEPGNVGLCGNRTAIKPRLFEMAVDKLLSNLTTTTPRIKDLFVAISNNITGSNRSVYAIAQCVPTLVHDGCQDCLRVAHSNIRNCLPDIVEARALDAGCFMRYSNRPFFSLHQTTIVTPFRGKDSSKKEATIGGVVGGIVLASLVLVLMFMWLCRSKKRTTLKGNSHGPSDQLPDPMKYSYGDLKKATKNFSDNYKLGEGGSGDVYKGVVKNGNKVAVKRLVMGSNSVKEAFESEVRVISNVHHRNLIRLLGTCSDRQELQLLVLEYMENGSLVNFLYGERKGILNWKQRCDIIYGMAKGLAYLHEQYHVTIIHRDIKPSNILLDNDFQPKIADFGLARLLPEDKTHISTRFAGTYGYTAPEYAIHGQLSEKVDTYSFGLVMLEILSGKRYSDVLDASFPDEYLLEHAWKLYENHMSLKLIDEILDPSEYTEEGVNKFVEIALMCAQSQASERPSMSEVLMLLDDRSRDQKPPTRMRFDVAHLNLPDDLDNTYDVSVITNAVASITELTGR